MDVRLYIWIGIGTDGREIGKVGKVGGRECCSVLFCHVMSMLYCRC